MTTQHAGTSPQRETSSKPLSSGFRKTGSPAGPRTGGTSSYSALLAQVKEAGLLRRRRGFYWALFTALVVATAACWVVFFPFGFTTVVVRLDSHGLFFRPGRHSHTVGDSCAEEAGEANAPAPTDTTEATTHAPATRANRVTPGALAVRRAAR
jgi:hypothetical protein